MEEYSLDVCLPLKKHTLRVMQNYRGEEKGLRILLSYCQAVPGRKVKQGQEEISRNQTPTIFLVSVCLHDLSKLKQERKSILQKVKLFSRVQK